MRAVEIHASVCMLLEAVGIENWEQDPDFKDTPKRVARMYIEELCAGLFEPSPDVRSFPKPDGMDQIIVVGPCIVHSLCPHHLAPILGNAWVGVLPNHHVLGLSKYARIVRWCAARPIMQESLTEMIANNLQAVLNEPRGVAVVIKAEHLCMKWRGVREANALTTTSAMRGTFREHPEARSEFLRLIE